MRVPLFIFCVVLLVPAFAHADIMVTEIAWMGTSASANDEWIEIHNSGSSATNLSGWTLNASDGTPSISLSGTIDAGAYALLERTDDSSEPGHAALVIFTGALGNDGEDLILRNGGSIVQSLNFSSGWPAGDATSRQTMQWTGTTWVTAEATPGEATSASGNENPTNTQTTTTDDDEDDEDVDSARASTAPAEKKYTSYVTDIVVKDTSIPAGAPVEFSLKTRSLDGMQFVRGNFFWNMGDGTERQYFKADSFTHTYTHPGTYIVSVRYFKTMFEGIDPDATDKITITVYEPTVTIQSIHPDGSVELKNTSSQEVELSGWQLKDAFGKSFIIPEGTFIAANKIVTFDGKRLRLRSGPGTVLMTPNNATASSYALESVAVASAARATSSSSSPNTSVLLKEAPQKDQVTRLNDLNRASVVDSGTQKGSSLWIILFAVLIFGSAALVYVFFRRDEGKQQDVGPIEDEFELLE